MSNYKICLERFEEIAHSIAKSKGSGELRFNRSIVIASDIAGQYFCEKKIELQYLHGKVETEAMLQGTEGHEELLEGSTEVEQEELFKKIFGKKPIFALEMLLLGKYGKVILCGKPDSVLFHKGIPKLIFEYKFSRRSTTYPSYHVQARTYGLLLEKMGFYTSNLFYVIVVANPLARSDPQLKDQVTQAIKEHGYKEAIIPLTNATIYMHKYEQASAKKNVDWALEFWEKKRTSIATTNFAKCKSCEYYIQCHK